MPSRPKKSFRESLFNQTEFTLTFELVPNRGGRGKGQNRILQFANEAVADGRIQAVSITENAGGHPTLAPDVLGREIRKLGLDVINHFSCKDKNRNQIESQLFAWDREHFTNLLVLSGDYPRTGFQGQAKPVFDLCSVQALELISHMNNGTTYTGTANAEQQFQPTSFLKGVAVSPFKLLESELTLQYLKLGRKIKAGADYIITQLGFDARKFQEVIQFLQKNNYTLPILGNVFIPTLTVTKMMHNGDIPGCIIPDDLYQQIITESQSKDKGKKERLLRAAKLLTILKGLGYAGAHIGGPGLLFEDVKFVLDKASQLEDSWQQYIPELSFWPHNGHYFFHKDTKTGLNTSQQRTLKRAGRKNKSSNYLFAKSCHELLFSPKSQLFRPMRRLCFSIENHGFEKSLDVFEYFIKMLLFNCRNCGDCRLSDLAYLCPQSGCAKFLLNGPCGGSQDGWCEIYPGQKRCFYVRLYERLTRDEIEELFSGETLPPRDWSRNWTSSWINFFHDFDNKNSPSTLNQTL